MRHLYAASVDATTRFFIEDTVHAEGAGPYEDIESAWLELERRAAIPWDEPPNLPPCTEWRTCRREFIIVEKTAEGSQPRWYAGGASVTPILTISESGVEWGADRPSG